MPQTTLPLQPGHPLKNLMGLARQIALPHEHEPERFPSFPALERTAKLGFNQPSTIDVPANTTRKFALFRQAAYPVWGERTATGTDGYVFSYASSRGVGGVTSDLQEATAVIANNVYQWTNTNVAVTNTTVGTTGLPATPGLYPYAIAGIDTATGPRPWVYIPPGAIAYIIVRSYPANPQWTPSVQLEIWDAPGELHTYDMVCTTVTTNTGASTALLQTGWVRPATVTIVSPGTGSTYFSYFIDFVVSTGFVSYTASTTTAGTVTFTSNTTTQFVPLVAPSEFQNSQMPWYSTRVTAAAMLATNVTTVLNKGGTILAGRVSPQVQSPWTVASNTINLLHPAEKAFLPLETGLYTYCPPSTDMATFWDYTLPRVSDPSLPTIAAAPVHRLDNDAMVNFAFLTSPANIESMALNIDWHVEFRTSSALFDVGMSAVTLETLHQAQLVLAQVGFFFENFDHKRVLNLVIAAAKKYAPTMLGAVNPLAGQVADWVLSKVPQPGMQTTTVDTKRVDASVPRVMARPDTGSAREAPGYSAKKKNAPKTKKKKGGLQMFLDKQNAEKKQ